MVRNEGLETEVALKVLRRDIDPDGQAVQRLKDEGRLLSSLNHPAILRVHDLVVLDGRIALITEFVDGDDLSECMRGEDRLGTKALLQAMAILAGALDAAWNTLTPDGDGPLHMVHRDLKPSNVRLSRHGDVKLLDFGIARTDSAAVDRESRTRTGMMVGSPAYMAPERFMDPAIHLGSDVFSLCAMLFEGTTGDRFYGDLPIPMQVGLAVDDERYGKHLERALARIDDPGLRSLLQDGMVYDVQERPTPGDLARRLDALAEATPGPSLAQFCRQRRWSEALRLDGELLGRTLSETLPGQPRPPADTLVQPFEHALSLDPPTLALAQAAADPPASGSRRWLWGLVGVGALTAVLLGLGALLVTGGLAAAFPYLYPSAPVGTPSLPVPIEPAPPEPAPPEPAPPEAAPEPAPRPEPVESAPPVQPTPAPPAVEPRSVEPTPPAPPVVEPVAPSPPRPTPKPSEPPPPTPATGPFVRLTGGVAAVLVGSGGTHRLPGAVPPGTYRLMALFNGLDRVDVRAVTVEDGVPLTIDCSAAFTRCTVKP